MSVKMSAYLTDNNGERLGVLLKHNCYENKTDAINAVLSRGLPYIERDMGVKRSVEE